MVGAKGRLDMAFIGFEKKGVEELRDHESALYQLVEELFVNSGSFDMVSMRMINAAKRRAGISSFEDLLLKDDRQAFLAPLFEQGIDPDYFVWGTFTTQTSTRNGSMLSSGRKQRRYHLTMEMIDTRTGQLVAKRSGTVDKAYRN